MFNTLAPHPVLSDGVPCTSFDLFRHSGEDITHVTIDDVIYDQVTIQDAPCSGVPGEPLLPTKGAYLLLPADTLVDSITITGERTLVGSGLTITPCGAPIPLIPDAPEGVTEPDQGIYQSSEEFPGSLFHKVGVYQYRGYSILVLVLFPIQYIPRTGDLFYYPTLTVTVSLSQKHSENLMFRNSAIDQSELLLKIQNPSVEITYQQPFHAPIVSDQYDLLILTTDAFKTRFQPLADQHNATGKQTIIRTLTDVGGSTPEAIRSYAPLFQPAVPVAFRSNVRGVTFHSVWGLDFYTISK